MPGKGSPYLIQNTIHTCMIKFRWDMKTTLLLVEGTKEDTKFFPVRDVPIRIPHKDDPKFLRMGWPFTMQLHPDIRDSFEILFWGCPVLVHHLVSCANIWTIITWCNHWNLISNFHSCRRDHNPSAARTWHCCYLWWSESFLTCT